MKTLMSLNSIFNGHTVASSADGIPLDTFTSAGAQAVVSLSAAWGLGQLVICLLSVLVLARYRTLIPFMFALLLLEHLSRRLIFHIMPIARTGTLPGSTVNLVLLTLMVAGLVLSLWSRAKAANQSKLQTSASITPAADAPVAPPSDAAGL
jgi:hypothetical protein